MPPSAGTGENLPPPGHESGRTQDPGPPGHDPGEPYDPGPPGGHGPRGPKESTLERLRLLLRFFRYLRPVKGLVAVVLIGTVLGALLALPATFVPQVLTNRFDDKPFIYGFFGLVLGTFVVGWGLGLLMAYAGARLGESLVMALRNDAFGQLERLSMLSVFSRGPGEFVQELGRDVYQVREVIEDTLMRTGMSVAQGVTVFITMIYLRPVTTLILVGVFLLMSLIIRIVNRKIEAYAAQGRALEQSITGQLVENVGGFRDIVAAGKFERFARQFYELLLRAAAINVKTAVLGQTAGLVPAIVVSLSALAVYVFGVRGAVDVAEIGGIITYAMLLNKLFPAVLAAAQWTSSLAVAMPSLRALDDVLSRQSEIGPAGTDEVTFPVESITFDQVSLEISDRPIVHDLTFAIPGGKFTAIVGQSGAGKTTVFHLLLRLLEPTRGVVRLNDQPLDEYALESLRATVGFIPQRPFLFNQSLRENLLMGASELLPPEQLNEAVAVAQLGELVERRQQEGGLDASAGYLGNRLSGGEQQRIALGRLILQDPQVIICDEYTANIDVQTASLIRDAMRTRFHGRTRVVITHELYTVRGADHIIVLDEGQVVDSGTHQELVARPGLYRTLCEVQSLD